MGLSLRRASRLAWQVCNQLLVLPSAVTTRTPPLPYLQSENPPPPSALRPPPLAVLSFTPDGTVERRRQTTCVHRRQELQGMLTKLEAAGMPAIDISGERGLQRRMRGTSLAGGSMSSRSVSSDLSSPSGRTRCRSSSSRCTRRTPSTLGTSLYSTTATTAPTSARSLRASPSISTPPPILVLMGALSEEEKEVEARRDLDRWLTEEQGYPFVEETENVVYRRFLREG
ncbi:hypothetical protein CF335_g9268 [Tilletia laevis]|nr:hypothetical protein CF335_g9268 [Tilletia laevis]